MVVLDASAVLALLNQEAGAEMVEPLLDEAVISAVNLSEVAGKLIDRGLTQADVRAALDSLQLDVRPFDSDHAYRAAGLRAVVPKDFALGDRACLALASALQVEAFTADREWRRLQLPDILVTVIR
ncbi:MAG: type II toxin-antitoxin system VapC family toxin [Candidatus Dormibacteria bacterium]